MCGDCSEEERWGRSTGSLSALEAFARECIAADRYPDDNHVFRPFQCAACGAMAFEPTIEHHTGSAEGDFKGVIWGECAACGRRQRLFSFIGQHRTWLREEKPVCACGNGSFVVAECERIEGEKGLQGFFDEGVVVGACCGCGHNQAFVYTD
jgi:hypothetical protein